MNPNLIIGVVTNGSTLNDRIKNLLEQGKFQLNISIDAVDKEIYESVRHDAGFDTLLCNFEWFKQYGIRHNLPVIVPVCPLVNNWENIPAVIRFANRNDVTVNFVYVDRPLSLSLPMQSAAFLENIISRYQSEVFEQHSASAKLNVNRFNDLIKDLTTWKKEAINAAPPLLFENARQILIEKISDWISNHGEGSSSESHQELIFKIEQILQALPETKRVKMLSVFNSYSPERIFQFINGKTVEELISFFKEYAGEKRL